MYPDVTNIPSSSRNSYEENIEMMSNHSGTRMECISMIHPIERASCFSMYPCHGDTALFFVEEKKRSHVGSVKRAFKDSICLCSEGIKKPYYKKSMCKWANPPPSVSDNAAFFSSQRSFLTTDLTRSYNKCASTLGLCSTFSHYLRKAAEERQVFDLR